MVFLALLPAAVLLFFVYKLDKKEKEPMKFLWMCFLLGVLSSVPAIIIEIVGDFVFGAILTEGSFIYAFAECIFVVALAEEGGKYLMLRLKTWKSPNFNCTYDGIIYAVFVSLGFAAFENIFYVAEGGVSDALTRMFTAVPSHATDAIFMGVFYSKAKQAQLLGQKSKAKCYNWLAFLVPLGTHGIYDALLSVDEEVAGEALSYLCYFAWFPWVIGTFVAAFVILFKASKNDRYFYMQTLAGTIGMPGVQVMRPVGPGVPVAPVQQAQVQQAPPFALRAGNWICRCGNINGSNFCPNCGAGKETAAWK